MKQELKSPQMSGQKKKQRKTRKLSLTSILIQNEKQTHGETASFRGQSFGGPWRCSTMRVARFLYENEIFSLKILN